jgi:Asp-tRNA(Asn)/Glu-tRNA(Gln) amidotransferase A subunit family amidase
MAGEELAFSSVTELARQIQAKRLSPVELTEASLERLKRLDPKLLAVITLTEERARAEARQAEQEIGKGRYRGPLHGIPYGLKDLFDTKDIRTTWGIKYNENRVPAEDATVVRKLRDAGAVLVAKLSMGELARGARWFGGATRCPWDPTRSSGGSSAGPAAATAAGMVGFAIGTETMGSLVGPCATNGVSGLRPTYGRVSRAGAMTLGFTIDKVGPLCRSVEDCNLVFDAIRGVDPRDPSTVDVPHRWDSRASPAKLRVGVVEEEFEGLRDENVKRVMQEALGAIERLGVSLKPIQLPDYPYNSVFEIVRGAEAAVFFEDLITDDHLATLSDNAARAWKNLLPVARVIPAVQYLKGQQVRALMQADAVRLMETVDVWVAPAGGPAGPAEGAPAASPAPARPAGPARPAPRTSNFTNLTGLPVVCVPAGFVEGLPVGIQFVGRSFDEASILTLAQAYQRATGWHTRHPKLE